MMYVRLCGFGSSQSILAVLAVQDEGYGVAGLWFCVFFWGVFLGGEVSGKGGGVGLACVCDYVGRVIRSTLPWVL